MGSHIRRRELTYSMIKDLVRKDKDRKTGTRSAFVWQAYAQLKQANGSAKNELIALVSLIRKVCGIRLQTDCL